MEQLTLIIGNKNYSSWSLRPWILLTQSEIPFTEIVIPLREAGSKEKVLQFSPAGKVPILLHGDLKIWESIAIAEYIADLFPEKKLWPQDLKARALARAISAEMHAGFMDFRKACPMNVKARKPTEFSPEVQRDITRITSMWIDCRKQFAQQGPFLFGHFTIADAMYAPIIWRFNTYGATCDGLALEYFKTMRDLPAMKKWEEAALAEKWVMPQH